MSGIAPIFRKEMEDHFTSVRFVLITALIFMVGIIVTSMVGMGLRSELEGYSKPAFVFLLLFTATGRFFSFTQFMGFFGPLMGIILGFDSINRERIGRTLTKLLSQPIYRDSVINAKFLSGIGIIGLILLGMILLICGLNFILVGVVPGGSEIVRLFLYFVVTLVYISFWLSVSILFSILFRSTATSALASLALWIFLSFFLGIGGAFIADALAPLKEGPSIDPSVLLRHERIQRTISFFSPISVYTDTTSILLDPLRKTTKGLVLMGPLERLSISRFQGPLPVLDSFLIVLPHVVSLVALTLVSFAICYLVFMRQEIRSA